MTSKIETLRQALRDILAQHQTDGTLPTSARFLFYELVAANVVSKHATGARRADQGVIDALKGFFAATVARSRGIGSSTKRAHSRTTPAFLQSSSASGRT